MRSWTLPVLLVVATGCGPSGGDDASPRPDGGTASSGREAGAVDAAGDAGRVGGRRLDDGGPRDGAVGDAELDVGPDAARREPACGDEIIDFEQGELCDPGPGGASFCVDCRPMPIDHSQDLSGMRHDVAVAPPAAGAPFLVAWYAINQERRLLLGRVGRDGAVLGEPVPIGVDVGRSPSMTLASHPEAGVLAAWRGRSPTDTFFVRLSAALQPDGEPAELDGHRHMLPLAALARDGNACVLGRVKAAPARLTCFDPAGVRIQGRDLFPESFGGHDNFGMHALFAHGDGFVAAYVMDDDRTVLARRLDARAEPSGGGSHLFRFEAGGNVWLKNGAGGAGVSSFLALAGWGDLQSPQRRRLYFRAFDDWERPRSEPTPVNTVPGENDQDGVVVRRPGGGPALVAWAVYEPGAELPTASCRLRGRLFDADLDPRGDAFLLFDPGPERCPRWVRGAATAEGDVMLAWELDDASANPTLQLLPLPGLLADR